MRVEIRHSDGETCELCESFPVISTKKGDELSQDMAAYLDEEWQRREHRLRGLIVSERKSEAARARAELDEFQARVVAAEEQKDRAVAAVISAFRELPGDAGSRWHPIRNRRHRVLVERVEAVVDELKAETWKV